jgi:LacI family transcriptional regulator
MKKGITIKDIAVKLNMSVSTVSKALNNDLSISTPTKERVKQLANDWNYIPNEAARHFKLSKTFTLGLIIPDLLDQFFVLAINGAEKIAATEKYNVIISQSHEDPANEEKIVDLMKRNRVDGLIVVITKKSEDMSAFLNLKNIGIPVVFLARPPKDDSFDYVTADNEGGAFKATEYLINQGHQRIGHLMGPECMAVSQLRLQGYKAALQRIGSALIRPRKSCRSDRRINYSCHEPVYENEIPPTGIFTFKNYISLDAIEYLKRTFPEWLIKLISQDSVTCPFSTSRS